MRRLFSTIAVILCFALLFAACGETATTSSDTSSLDIASEDATVSEEASSEEVSSEEASSEAVSSEEPVISEEPVVKEEPKVEDHPNYTKEYTVVQKPLSERNNLKRAKILVMGDSYTSGDGTASAYRHALFCTLQEEGAFFEFVGDQKSGDLRLSPLYLQHMAQGGRTTSQLTTTYKNSAAGGKIDYDIALILIGGNDFYGSKTPEALADEFKKLIDTMIEDRPDALIYFSEMCYYGNIATSKIDKANELLNALVDDYKANGKNVECVDLDKYVKFTSQDDLMNAGPSGAHPNQQGNWKLGYAYGMALKDAVLKINERSASNEQSLFVDPISMTLSKKELTLKTDEQGSIYYTIAPADSDVRTALWSSSDPYVASVNEYGVVTAHKAGEAVLTARVVGTNIIQTCKVTVTSEKFKLEYFSDNEVLKESFANGDKWNGDAASANGSFTKYWTTAVEASSKDKLKLDTKNSSITFLMLTSNQMGANSTATNEISFGKYTIYGQGNMRNIELRYDGTVIGSFKCDPYTFPMDRFTLRFIDGVVYFYRNNELIITANAPQPIDGLIKIKNDGNGTFRFDELLVCTY